MLQAFRASLVPFRGAAGQVTNTVIGKISHIAAPANADKALHSFKNNVGISNSAIAAGRTLQGQISSPTTGSGPVAVQSVLSPQQVYDKAVETGEAKANGPFAKTFVSAVLAGAYVGFGAMLALSIGGNCPDMAASNPGLQKMVFGAFGLPVGLLMVLVCGAELFTSNAAMVPAAVYERRARLAQLARNWAIAYSGNMVGALMLVGIAAVAGIFHDAPSGAMYYATYKTSHSFLETFGRGILCNWLVCLAVWQATAANTLGGKAIAVWFPISAFVAMGLEHSVANMFIIPMGMAAGADVTVSQFLWNNLLPVTLGNIVAGTTFVAGAYSCIYGTLLKRILGSAGAQRGKQAITEAVRTRTL
ncbi:hypothetical protein WJX74_005559 [Apatococcus lobatus]|uniref:Uncharacterized protein n=1 Tax=Apatococcus lobatus TaxID=904363 RepID=A0AAW1S3L6_9CHLO